MVHERLRPVKISRRLAPLICLIMVVSACGGEARVSPSAAPTKAEPVATTILPTTAAAPAPTTGEAPRAPAATVAPTTTVPATTTTTVPGPELSALNAALANSAAIASGRMEGVFEIVGIKGVPAGAPAVALTFSGAFDTNAGTSSFVMDMSDFANVVPADEVPPEFADLFGVIEVRQIGDTSYMRFPFFSSFLGVETDWISFPTEEQSATDGLAPVTPVNPSEFLNIFQSVGASVSEVGTEEIRGEETVHYVVLFDMADLIRQSDPEQLAELENLGPLPFDELPMDIWISEDGLVHRFEIVFDAASVGAAPDDGFERMVMRFDMFDHGLPVDIQPPPDDDVTDAGELVGFFGV